MYVGLISTYDEEMIKFKELDSSANIQKTKMIKTKNISLLSYNDIYGKDLELLYKAKVIDNATKNKYIYNKKSSKFFKEHLLKSKNLKEVVSIFGSDDYFIGTIIELNETYIKLNNISFQGHDDGVTIIPINLIIKIRKNGKLERKVKYLYNIKKLDL
jgi:hypothetical protein